MKYILIFFLLPSISCLVCMDTPSASRPPRYINLTAFDFAHANPAQKRTLDEETEETKQGQNVTKKKRGPTAQIKCPDCKKSVESSDKLCGHILACHTDFKPYTCGVNDCRFATAVRHSLSLHRKRIHNDIKKLEFPLPVYRQIAEKVNPFLNKKGWTTACPECSLLLQDKRCAKLHAAKTHVPKNQEPGQNLIWRAGYKDSKS